MAGPGCSPTRSAGMRSRASDARPARTCARSRAGRPPRVRLGVPRPPTERSSMLRTVDPDQVGLDPRQLARLDAHFAGYVDDGRLAGWQLIISRAGQVAHEVAYGLRD